MYMSPGFDEVAGTVAVVHRTIASFAFSPWVPPAVHFMIETQEEGMAPILGVRRPARDVRVISAPVDIPRLEIRLIRSVPEPPRSPVDHRNGSMIADSVEHIGLKFAPAPIAQHPRLSPMNDGHPFPRVCLKCSEHSLHVRA